MWIGSASVEDLSSYLEPVGVFVNVEVLAGFQISSSHLSRAESARADGAPTVGGGKAF